MDNLMIYFANIILAKCILCAFHGVMLAAKALMYDVRSEALLRQSNTCWMDLASSHKNDKNGVNATTA